MPQVALERDGAGSLQRRYTYGLRRISMTSGSTTRYFHHDPIGSVTNITSSSGSRQWTGSYEPFGVNRTSSGSSPTNFMKFTGESLDATGLYHLRARQYDPATGRFLRTDPLDPEPMSPSISAYVYADDQPTTEVDPTGLMSEPCPDGRVLASFSVGPAPDANSGDQCTVVPDAIGAELFNRIRTDLIDFSPSCQIHDDCYGRWTSKRRGCDERFKVNMLEQCKRKYSGRFDVRRNVCNGVAATYHYGVQQLGNMAFFDKAERYDPGGLDRVPIPQDDQEGWHRQVDPAGHPEVQGLRKGQELPAVEDDTGHRLGRDEEQLQNGLERLGEGLIDWILPDIDWPWG